MPELRTARRSRRPRRLLAAIVIAAATLISTAWRVAAANVCRGCYRLGNHLDFWLQRELLLHAGTPASTAAAAGPNALARGIWQGVSLRRWLRLWRLHL